MTKVNVTPVHQASLVLASKLDGNRVGLLKLICQWGLGCLRSSIPLVFVFCPSVFLVSFDLSKEKKNSPEEKLWL